MSTVSLTCPVLFNSPKSLKERVFNFVEESFYFGGDKAFVIQGSVDAKGNQGVILQKNSVSLIEKALKVAKLVIFFPVLIPLKVAFRMLYRFHIVPTPVVAASAPVLSPALGNVHLQQAIQQVKASVPKAKSIEELIAQEAVAPIKAVSLKEAELELEKDFTIPDEVMIQLESLTIDPLVDCKEIEWFSKGATNLIFRLKQYPDFVFKTGIHHLYNNLVNKRFANMVVAKQVCMNYGLDALVIPQAKRVEVNENVVIAEKFLPHCQDEYQQEEYYQTLPHLEKALVQLVVLIGKTGFSDVDWRNIPIINPQEDSSKCIGLIDLEEMDLAFSGAAKGIFGEEGAYPRRGLIGCLPEKQIDLVLKVAKREKIDENLNYTDLAKLLDDETYSPAVEKRRQDIALDVDMQAFYQAKGILQNPRQIVQIKDYSQLGLDPEIEGELGVGGPKCKLRVVVEQVLTLMNNVITTSSISNTPKGIRRITLHPEAKIFKPYKAVWVVDQQGVKRKQNWFEIALNALEKGKVIFKILKATNQEDCPIQV
jgi:hypothetical protein